MWHHVRAVFAPSVPLYSAFMSTKKPKSGTLSPRERERLLQEADARAKAIEERPARQAANAKRLAEQRSGLTSPGERPNSHVHPEDRARIAERTRSAAMEAWKTEHERQLAKED